MSFEEACKIYGELAMLPSFSSAYVVPSTGSEYNFFATQSQQCVEENLTRSTLLTFSSDGQSSSLPFPLSDDVAQISVSPSGRYVAIFRKGKTDDVKKPATGGFLDLYSRNRLLSVTNLEKIHGRVYNDSMFSRMSWNADETKLVYVADRASNDEAQLSYWDKLPNGKSEGDVTRGSKYDYSRVEDWGEQYRGYRVGRLFIAHIRDPAHASSGAAVAHVSHVSPVEGVADDVHATLPVFTPDGESVVFTGWEISPRRFGIRFCMNRHAALYCVSLGDENSAAKRLTPEGESATSGLFSPKGDSLVYLSNTCFGPHNAAKALKEIPYSSKGAFGTPSVVIDVVDGVPSGKNDAFPGLFSDKIHDRCWVDDRRLLLATQWRSEAAIVMIDVREKTVRRMSASIPGVSRQIGNTRGNTRGSLSLLSVAYGWCLFSFGCPNRSHTLCAARVAGDESVLDSNVLIRGVSFADVSYDIHSFSPSTPDETLMAADIDQSIEVIYIGPNSCDSAREPTPLVLSPHGGPHSASSCSFDLTAVMMAKLGFATMHVNYRGSTGFGQKPLLTLPGRAGTQDVNDCLDAARYAVECLNADSRRMCVSGGSHGGFLASHLLVSHSDKFAAIAMRNPVTNIDAMSAATDIPDWTHVEALGVDYLDHIPWERERVLPMFDCSPIARAPGAKLPTFIMLGAADMRVPPSQGIQLYHALKRLGVDVTMHVYPEDNHSLSSVSVASECAINIYLHFARHV